MLIVEKHVMAVWCIFESCSLVINLDFCLDFEHKVWSDCEAGFGQDFEVLVQSQNADIWTWLRF